MCTRLWINETNEQWMRSGERKWRERGNCSRSGMGWVSRLPWKNRLLNWPFFQFLLWHSIWKRRPCYYYCDTVPLYHGSGYYTHIPLWIYNIIIIASICSKGGRFFCFLQFWFSVASFPLVSSSTNKYSMLWLCEREVYVFLFSFSISTKYLRVSLYTHCNYSWTMEREKGRFPANGQTKH